MVARVSTNSFYVLAICLYLILRNLIQNFCIYCTYDVIFRFLKSHSPWTWWINRSETPITKSLWIFISIVIFKPRINVLYSALLFVQLNWSLASIGECWPDSYPMTTPIPFLGDSTLCQGIPSNKYRPQKLLHPRTVPLYLRNKS